MKFKKIIIYLISILFLYSCSSVKNTLEGKKRSDSSDEFFVEKKNPLTEPPDMNELPIPLNEEQKDFEINNEDSLDIEKVLNVEKSENLKEKKNNQENSLEQTILEKINN
jgi:hypothetical protein